MSTAARVSLRTKNRAAAKILVVPKYLTMTKNFQHLEPWEAESEEQRERYRQGLAD